MVTFSAPPAIRAAVKLENKALLIDLVHAFFQGTEFKITIERCSP